MFLGFVCCLFLFLSKMVNDNLPPNHDVWNILGELCPSRFDRFVSYTS